MASDISDYASLIEKIAKQLYDGKVTAADLNEELLKTTLNDLRNGMTKGAGTSFTNYDKNSVRNLSLNQHLYRFSGAKTYQEIAKINFFLKDKTSFSEFKKEALKINDTYNKRHLETEYNTANRSGEQYKKWLKYEDQKDLYPNLKYKTANDDRVRQQHKDLQDIIKPINDPFWLSWYPPNDFGCRCYVTQTDKSPTKGEIKDNPSPGFNNNVGVSNMVFAEDQHPYFIFPAKDVKKIKQSFENLKISSPDYQVVFESKKAKLQVSTWSDPKDFEANYSNAKALVSSLRIDVKIRNHSEVDGIKNAEYEIRNQKSDLKVLESPTRGIENGFKSMKEKMKFQKGNYTIVFNIDNVKLKISDAIRQLSNKVSKDRGLKVESVFFVKNGKAIELTRKNILDKDFKKLEDLL